MATCNLITANVAASDLVTDALGTAGTPVSIRATANAYATHISLIDTQYRSVIENNVYRLRVVASALGANFTANRVATKLKVNPADLTGLSSKVAAKSKVIPFAMNLKVGLPVTYPTLKLSTTADFASGMFGVVNSKLYLSPAGLRVDLAAAPVGLALSAIPTDLNQILNLIEPDYIACSATLAAIPADLVGEITLEGTAAFKLNSLASTLNLNLNLPSPQFRTQAATLAVVKPRLTVGIRGTAAFKLKTVATPLNLNLNLPSPQFRTQAATLAVRAPVLRLGGIDTEDLYAALSAVPVALNQILNLIEPDYIACSATLAAIPADMVVEVPLEGTAAFKLDTVASTLNLNLNLPSPQFRTQAATLAVVKPLLTIGLRGTAAFKLKTVATTLNLNLNLPSPEFRTQAATLAVVKPRLNLLLGSATAALALKHNSTEFPLNLVATLGSTTSAATLNSISIPNTHIQMGITLFPAVSAYKLAAIPVLNADFTTNPTLKDLTTGSAAFKAATTATLINIIYVQTATNPVFSRLTSTVVKVPYNNVVIVPPPNFITLPVVEGSFAFTLKFASLALNEIMALSPAVVRCKAASSSYMRLEAMPVPVAASSVVALKAGENLRLRVNLAIPATPPGASLGVIKSELTVILSTLEGKAAATSNSQLFTMRLLVGLFGTPKAALAANKPDLDARRLITELDQPTMPVVALKLKAIPAYLPYGGPSGGGANSYVLQEFAKYPIPTGTSMAVAVTAEGNRVYGTSAVFGAQVLRIGTGSPGLNNISCQLRATQLGATDTADTTSPSPYSATMVWLRASSLDTANQRALFGFSALGPNVTREAPYSELPTGYGSTVASMNSGNAGATNLAFAPSFSVGTYLAPTTPVLFLGSSLVRHNFAAGAVITPNKSFSVATDFCYPSTATKLAPSRVESTVGTAGEGLSAIYSATAFKLFTPARYNQLGITAGGSYKINAAVLPQDTVTAQTTAIIHGSDSSFSFIPIKDGVRHSYSYYHPNTLVAQSTVLTAAFAPSSAEFVVELADQAGTLVPRASIYSANADCLIRITLTPYSATGDYSLVWIDIPVLGYSTVNNTGVVVDSSYRWFLEQCVPGAQYEGEHAIKCVKEYYSGNNTTPNITSEAVLAVSRPVISLVDDQGENAQARLSLPGDRNLMLGEFSVAIQRSDISYDSDVRVSTVSNPDTEVYAAETGGPAKSVSSFNPNDLYLFLKTDGTLIGRRVRTTYTGPELNTNLDPILPAAVKSFIAGGGKFTKIKVGESVTALLSTSNRLYLWGYNTYGHLDVPTVVDADFVTNGYIDLVKEFDLNAGHLAVILTDDKLYGWGCNHNSTVWAARDTSQVNPVSAFEIGEQYSVGFISKNVAGTPTTVIEQFGNAPSTASIPAGLVLKAKTLVHSTAGKEIYAGKVLACGQNHTVALKSDGTVVCWGNNDTYGQCTVPGGLTGVVAVAAGDNHTLALKSDGVVYAWGLNTDGQCTVPAGLNAKILSAGGNFSAAIRSAAATDIVVGANNDEIADTIACWGLNTNGQCTVPKCEGLSYDPGTYKYRMRFWDVQCGWDHVVAVRKDNEPTKRIRDHAELNRLAAGGERIAFAFKSAGGTVIFPDLNFGSCFVGWYETGRLTTCTGINYEITEDGNAPGTFNSTTVVVSGRKYRIHVTTYPAGTPTYGLLTAVIQSTTVATPTEGDWVDLELKHNSAFNRSVDPNTCADTYSFPPGICYPATPYFITDITNLSVGWSAFGATPTWVVRQIDTTNAMVMYLTTGAQGEYFECTYATADAYDPGLDNKYVVWGNPAAYDISAAIEAYQPYYPDFTWPGESEYDGRQLELAVAGALAADVNTPNTFIVNARALNGSYSYVGYGAQLGVNLAYLDSDYGYQGLFIGTDTNLVNTPNAKTFMYVGPTSLQIAPLVNSALVRVQTYISNNIKYYGVPSLCLTNGTYFNRPTPVTGSNLNLYVSPDSYSTWSPQSDLVPESQFIGSSNGAIHVERYVGSLPSGYSIVANASRPAGTHLSQTGFHLIWTGSLPGIGGSTTLVMTGAYAVLTEVPAGAGTYEATLSLPFDTVYGLSSQAPIPVTWIATLGLQVRDVRVIKHQLQAGVVAASKHTGKPGKHLTYLHVDRVGGGDTYAYGLKISSSSKQRTGDIGPLTDVYLSQYLSQYVGYRSAIDIRTFGTTATNPTGVAVGTAAANKVASFVTTYGDNTKGQLNLRLMGPHGITSLQAYIGSLVGPTWSMNLGQANIGHTQTPGLTYGFDQVTCSQFHTVAIDEDGSVHAWGSNFAIHPASTTRGTWTPYTYSNTTCSATDSIPYLFTGYFRTFADVNDLASSASSGILDNSLFAGADLTLVEARNLLTYPSALPPASLCKGLFDTTGFTMLDISGFTLATGASLVLVSQQVAGPGIKIGLKNEDGQYRLFASDVYDNNTIYSNVLTAAPKLLHLSIAEDTTPVGVTYGSAGVVAQIKVDGDYIQWENEEYVTPAVSGLRYKMFMDYFGGQGLSVSLGSSLRKNMPSTSLTKLIASNTAFLGLYLNEAVASDKLRGSLVYPSAPGANAYYYSDLGLVAETTQGAISDGFLDLVGPNDYYLAKVTRNYKQATLAAPTGVYQSPNVAVPTDIRVAVGTNFKIFVGDINNDFDGPTDLSYDYNHAHVAPPALVDLNGSDASKMVWPKVVFPSDGTTIYNNAATTFDPASVYIYKDLYKLVTNAYTSADHYSCSVTDPGDGAYDAKPLVNSSGTPLENIVVYDSVSRRVLPQSYYPAANIAGGLSHIALGEQLTAVVSSGNVKHWGWNHWEQRAGLDTLQLTAAASPIAKIRCSATWSLSLKINGSVAAHTSYAGSATFLTPPTGTYTDIAAGVLHAAGVKTDGTVVVWGYSIWGVTTLNQPPASLPLVSHVACGAAHTVARTTAGGIVCWGSDEKGQCTIPNAVVNLLAGGVTVTEVACTQYQTVCRLSTGVVYWWGGNEFSVAGAYNGNSSYPCNPGIGTSKQHVFVVKTSDLRVYAPGVGTTQPADEYNITIDIPATANVTKLGQGITALHMCACTASTTFAWGTANSFYGQYAAPSYVPTTTSRLNASVNPTASTVVGPYKHVAVAIPAGGDIAAAVAAIPTAIRARNETPVYTASEVAGLAHVVDIAAGNNCLYAIQAASSGATQGTIVAWGLAGSDGALSSKPAGNTYTKLSARQRHAAALSADGTVACWGANANGQSTVPSDLGSGCTMVACGDTFTAAIKSTGFVACWGSLNTVPAPYNSIQFSTISCGIGHLVGRASAAYLTGVSGGDFTVAVGDVLAFGANARGQCNVPGFSYTFNNKGINCQAVAGGEFTAYSLPSSGFSIATCDGMLTYAEELEDVTAPAIQTSELAEGYLVHTAGALCAGVLPPDHPFAVVKPTSSLLPNRTPFGVAVLANTGYSNIPSVTSNATAIPAAYTRAGSSKAKLVTAGRYAHSQWVRSDHTFGAGYTIIVDQTTDRVTVVGGELLATGCDAATYTPPVDALALRAVPTTLGDVPLLQLATFRGTVYALDTGGVVTKWGYDDSAVLDYSIDATAKQYISIPDLAISDSLASAVLTVPAVTNTHLAVAYVAGIPGMVDSWSVDVRLDRYFDGTKTNIRKFTALGNSANYSIQNHVHFAETFLAVDTWPSEATRLDSQYVLSIIPRGVKCKVTSASLFAMNLDSKDSQQVRILNDADNMSSALTQVADFMLSTTSGATLQYSPLTNTGQATALSVTEDLTGVKVQTVAAVPESCYLRNSYGSSARVENLITTGAILGGRVPAVIALTPATAQAWPTIAAWYATEGLTGAVAATVSTWPQAAVGTTLGPLIQNTTSPQRQPAVVAYGALKGAQFDSTATAEDSMAVANNNAAVSGFTYCLVYNKAAVNSAGYHCAFGKSYNNGLVQGIGFNLGRPVLYQSNVISANAAGTQFTGNGIVCGYSDGASGSTYKGIRVNGTVVDLPAAPIMVINPLTPAGYHLGGKIAGVGAVAYHDNNDVYAEVLAFESALTLTQLQEVEGYLASKFNLQSLLPVGHPYKAAGPVQSTLDILVVPALQDAPLILKESNRLTASTGVSQTWVGMYDVGVNHTGSRIAATGSVYDHNAPLLVEFEVDLNSTQTMLTIPGSFKLTTTSDLTVDSTTKYLVGKAALKSTVVAPTSGTQFLTTRTFLLTPVSLKLKTVAPSLALKLGLTATKMASTLRIRGGTDCTETYGCIGVSEFPPELTIIDPGPVVAPVRAQLRLNAALNGLVRMTYAAAQCKLASSESNLGIVLQLTPATIAAAATVNPSNIRSATIVLASPGIAAKLQIQVCEVDFLQLGPPISKYPYADGMRSMAVLTTPQELEPPPWINPTGQVGKGV